MPKVLRLSLLICSSTLLLYFLLLLPGVNGQSVNATAFLDERENLVQQIANFSLQNYLNTDALAATCNTNTNCSRAVCVPLLRDLVDGALTCEEIPNNVDCRGPNNTSCTNALVSMKEAYVRLGPDANVDNPTCNMRSTICAQRELDAQIFIPASNSNFVIQAWTYFGASNGIDRIYPGKELNETACTGYELRQRPWFVGATAVLKELVVMLDAGPSMGNTLSLNGYSVFDASINITLRLFNTLSQDDTISVFTFGSNASMPTIVGEKVSVPGSPSVPDTTVFNSLKDLLMQEPEPDISAVSKGNLTAILVQAHDQFEVVSNQLKVVIIITLGDLVGQDLQPDLVNSLRGNHVRVFIYRLFAQPASQFGYAGDDISATLSNISCSLRGWYEESLYEPQNPLGTIQSFYSYVAKRRFETNNEQPYWVPRYSSYSDIGDLITVAFPVFNGSFLVGVAGIDLVVDNLGDITSDVNDLLSGRNQVNSMIVTATTVPCGQKLLPGVQPQGTSCPQFGNASITGICTADVDNNPNTTERFLERVCCGNCPWKASHHGLSKGQKTGVIIGSVLGGLIFSLFMALCVYCVIHRATRVNPPNEDSGYRGPQTTHFQRDENGSGYFNKPL